MRLVDADKLEAHEQIVPLGNGMYESTFVIYKDDIDALPTVDAEPVRHARLINAHPYGECSCCGELIDSRDGFKYCPYCGAKMDGEREERREE